MAYSLKAFSNMNQGQAGAVSFTQPIKMPLSAMMKGKRSSGSLGTPPLSSIAAPWSGEGSDVAPVTPEALESGATDVTVPSEDAENTGQVVSGIVAVPSFVFGGLSSIAKAGYHAAKGESVKSDFIADLINKGIPKALDYIFGTSFEVGGQAPNTEGDIIGLEFGGQPAMHGQAAVESGQVAPVPGGLTPSSEGDTEGYGGGYW